MSDDGQLFKLSYTSALTSAENDCVTISKTKRLRAQAKPLRLSW